MKTYQAIVFDLDGTLIHSAPDLHAAANVALSEMGRDTLGLATVISFIGDGVQTLMDRCLDATGDRTEEERQVAFSRFLSAYDKDLTTLTTPYDGVLACLDHLHGAAIPLAICTNKPTRPAQDICTALDLTRYFAGVFGAQNDIAKKPAPEPLLAVVTYLGLRPQDVLYIGDSHVDYLTAQNANIDFRLFNGGYLKAPIPELSPDNRFDHWNDCGLDPLGDGKVAIR